MDNKPLAGTLVREYMYSEYFSCCQIPPLLYTYVAAVVPPPNCLTVGPETVALILNIR